MKSLCLLLFALLAPSARAIGVTPAPVRIVIRAAGAEAATAKLKAACKGLGKALLVGAGPWGYGIFRSFDCDVAKRNARDDAAPPVARVSIEGAAGSLHVRAYDAPPGNEKPIFDTKLTGVGEPATCLDDAAIRSGLAYAILQAFPAGIFVPKTDKVPERLSGPRPFFGEGSKNLAFPPPPPALVLFSLSVDSGTGRVVPKLVGRAKTEAVSKRDLVTYDLDEQASTARRATDLWASRGDAGTNEAVLTFVKTRCTQLLDAKKAAQTQAAQRTGAHVFLRYGRQILPGDSLLNRLQWYGILAEMYRGALSGLRYAYEATPATAISIDGVSGPAVRSIAWNRHMIGYGHAFSPPAVVDSITLTPKISVWSFSTTQPEVVDPIGRVIREHTFAAKRAPGFGADLESAVHGPTFDTEVRVGFDRGIPWLKSPVLVNEEQGSVDVAAHLGTLYQTPAYAIKLDALAFLTLDVVAFHDNRAPPADADLSYEAAYAGIGIGLGW